MGEAGPPQPPRTLTRSSETFLVSQRFLGFEAASRHLSQRWGRDVSAERG